MSVSPAPTPLSNWSLPALTLLQITTSGPSLERDALLEISLAQVTLGQLQTPWHRLIAPEERSFKQLQGFTRLDLQQGINIQQLQKTLDHSTQGQLVVAYGLREQRAFLKAAGVELKAAQYFCLQKAAAKINPAYANQGLLELAEKLGLMILRPFRAPDRLLLLWQLLVHWQPKLQEQFEQLVREQFQQRLLPPGLDPKLLEQIPDTPGVYRMYTAPPQADKAPLPLYIGKSIHLRTRVKSHFSADQRSSKALRIAQQIQFLDWITAAGDLGAQLKEAQQIKELQPLMNRRLRRQKKNLIWQQLQPYKPLQLVPFDEGAAKATGLAWGFFSSAHQARKQLQEKISSFALCPVCTGLEKRATGQPCFAFQLGHCRGACCGQESKQEHQQRLETALQQWQFESWPWVDGLILQETGAGGREYHALNAWQYLGSTSSIEEARQLALTLPRVFDQDHYRLLKQVLLPVREELYWQGSHLRLLD